VERLQGARELVALKAGGDALHSAGGATAAAGNDPSRGMGARPSGRLPLTSGLSLLNFRGFSKPIQMADFKNR
jgi:hypothetical protein